MSAHPYEGEDGGPCRNWQGYDTETGHVYCALPRLDPSHVVSVPLSVLQTIWGALPSGLDNWSKEEWAARQVLCNLLSIQEDTYPRDVEGKR